MQLDSFPLQSLTNECVRCYGLETGKISNDDDAGNYFALATVFPSTKVGLATILFQPFKFIILFISCKRNKIKKVNNDRCILFCSSPS